MWNKQGWEDSLVSRATTQCEQCWHMYIVIDSRKKRERLITAVSASAVLINDASRSIKELPFSCFPSLSKVWRTAKPGSEHVVDPMIRS